MPKKTLSITIPDPIFIEFTNDMRRFFKSCQVPEDTYEDLIDRRTNYIKDHIAATPELIARKIYEEMYEEQL